MSPPVAIKLKRQLRNQKTQPKKTFSLLSFSLSLSFSNYPPPQKQPLVAAATNDVTSGIARHGKVRRRRPLSCFVFRKTLGPSFSLTSSPRLPPTTKQTFAFLSTTANAGSVVACPTDKLNGTVSANCTTAVANLNAFAPASGAATAVVGGVSVQGLLAYVVVSNIAANKQAVVACDVNYLTGAFTGCVDSGAVLSGVLAVSPGLKGARVYAATQGGAAAAAGVGGAYECALAGKVISGCVLTASPASKFNGATQIALATRGFA